MHTPIKIQPLDDLVDPSHSQARILTPSQSVCLQIEEHYLHGFSWVERVVARVKRLFVYASKRSPRRTTSDDD
jgi:hypothetical protein